MNRNNDPLPMVTRKCKLSGGLLLSFINNHYFVCRNSLSRNAVRNIHYPNCVSHAHTAAGLQIKI